MGNMPITEENGQVTTSLNINEKRPRAVFNCLELFAPSSTNEKTSLHG